MRLNFDQEDLILYIISEIAVEQNKSIEKIKKLLLIKQNKPLNRRFWEILDAIMPGHPYIYFGCSASGIFELREQLPKFVRSCNK